MSVSIISLATIAISLSGVNITIDKTSYIKTAYDNIRKEFGIALEDRLSNKLGYKEEGIIMLYFNDTEDIFSYYASSIGYNFDAKYVGRRYIDNEPDGIIAILTLSKVDSSIEERVEYDI